MLQPGIQAAASPSKQFSPAWFNCIWLRVRVVVLELHWGRQLSCSSNKKAGIRAGKHPHLLSYQPFWIKEIDWSG